MEDKLLHAMFFAVFACGLTLFLKRYFRYDGVQLFWRVLAISLSFGIVIEVVQAFIPGRRCEICDIAADLSGALVGVVLASVYMLCSRRNK